MSCGVILLCPLSSDKLRLWNFKSTSNHLKNTLVRLKMAEMCCLWGTNMGAQKEVICTIISSKRRQIFMQHAIYTFGCCLSLWIRLKQHQGHWGFPEWAFDELFFFLLGGYNKNPGWMEGHNTWVKAVNSVSCESRNFLMKYFWDETLSSFEHVCTFDFLSRCLG